MCILFDEAMVFQDLAARPAMSFLWLGQGRAPRRVDMTRAQLGQLVSQGRIALLEEGRLAAMLPGRRDVLF